MLLDDIKNQTIYDGTDDDYRDMEESVQDTYPVRGKRITIIIYLGAPLFHSTLA